MTKATDTPTDDEIKRVGAWRCNQRGFHLWKTVFPKPEDMMVPTTIECSDCLLSLRVVKPRTKA